MHSEYSNQPELIAKLSRQLETDGFAVVNGVDSTDEHMVLASHFGNPVCDRSGAMLTRLTVKSHEEARPKSLSALHGQSAFPFHTDTAFWPLPCRVLTLRAVEGDLRRTTRVLDARTLLNGLDHRLIERSCWIVNGGMGAFYANLRDASKAGGLMRLDFGCMKPANAAARAISCELSTRTQQFKGIEIAWSAGMVLILDNWRMLHARSGPVENEGLRLLERIHLT